MTWRNTFSMKIGYPFTWTSVTCTWKITVRKYVLGTYAGVASQTRDSASETVTSKNWHAIQRRSRQYPGAFVFCCTSHIYDFAYKCLIRTARADCWLNFRRPPVFPQPILFQLRLEIGDWSPITKRIPPHTHTHTPTYTPPTSQIKS